MGDFHLPNLDGSVKRVPLVPQGSLSCFFQLNLISKAAFTDFVQGIGVFVLHLGDFFLLAVSLPSGCSILEI